MARWIDNALKRQIRLKDLRPPEAARNGEPALILGEREPGNPLSRGFNIARIENGVPLNEYGPIPGKFLGWWPLPALDYERRDDD